jgi:tritrans,polycis-undecaprenyl-diphosphate synthase [geranylgeranyl-diphosphate specific]
MLGRLRSRAEDLYEQVLTAELEETPTHVAVIQDGNRRYASKQGADPSEGHRAGAGTTEAFLDWCDELGIQEVTLYTFSTENFQRSPEEREALFDLIEEKLREFADSDRIHQGEVRINAIGQLDRLPERLRDTIAYAHDRTAEYDEMQVNIALAYGGRAELLEAARKIARDVDAGEREPAAVDVEVVEEALYEGPKHDVDLILRSGGDERTSNFLPWRANGNEAAVCFSAPYWPEFRKIDFLRAIRTYEHREESRRQTRARRAKALVQALGDTARSAGEEHLDRGATAANADGDDDRPADRADVDPAD